MPRKRLRHAGPAPTHRRSLPAAKDQWTVSRDWRIWAAGAAVTLVAAAIRFWGLNWDSTAALAGVGSGGFHGPATTHPDERAIFGAVMQLSAENWNPHFFAYGSLPMYLIKFAAWVASLAGPEWADHSHTALVGRFVGALFGTATVLATFRLGWKMFGSAAGVVGSAFLAMAVLHIQLSHFATTDIHVGLFAVLALIASYEIVLRGGMGPSIAAGVFWGLGTASKFNGVTIVGVVLAAHVLRAFEVRRLAAASRTRDERALALAELPGEWGTNLSLSLVTGVVAFTVAQPYAWLDAQACWGAVFGERDMVTGKDMRPYVQQYIHTPKIAYQTEFIVRWGMGPALGVLAFAAFAWATVVVARSLVAMAREAQQPFAALDRRAPRNARTRGRTSRLRANRAALSPPETPAAPSAGSPEIYAVVLLLAYLVPNFIAVGLFQVKFPRYLIALYPMWCLLAAYVLVRLYRAGGARRIASWSLAGAVAIPTLLWVGAFLRIYTAPHPYVQATVWAMQNIPPGTPIVTEHWNEEVPMYSGQGRFRMGDPLKIPVYDLPDDGGKARRIGSVLASAEYVCLGSSTLWATLIKLAKPDPRWPNNYYPVMSAFYRLLFDGKLGYERVHEVTKYPRFFSIEWNDDAVDVSDPSYRYRCDQSFSFYDHPRVIFFKRTEVLSPEEIARRIAEAAGLAGG